MRWAIYYELGTVGLTFTSLLTNLMFSLEIASCSRTLRLIDLYFLSLRFDAGLSETIMIDPFCDLLFDFEELRD